MGYEIERKFLPSSGDWRLENFSSHHIRQGYVARSHGNTVRIRISETPKGKRAVLCVKGTKVAGRVPEEEKEIGLKQAERLLLLCRVPVIEKVRHHIEFKGYTYEVDEFFGRLAGNVLIEVELDDPDERPDLPSWAGDEVTDDKAYTNWRLAKYGWPKLKPSYDPTTQTPPLIIRS